MSCKCQGCGRPYEVDIIVPDEIWELIKPDGKSKGSGLLCGSCICNKLEGLGQAGALRMEYTDAPHIPSDIPEIDKDEVDAAIRWAQGPGLLNPSEQHKLSVIVNALFTLLKTEKEKPFMDFGVLHELDVQVSRAKALLEAASSAMRISSFNGGPGSMAEMRSRDYFNHMHTTLSHMQSLLSGAINRYEEKGEENLGHTLAKALKLMSMYGTPKVHLPE